MCTDEAIREQDNRYKMELFMLSLMSPNQDSIIVLALTKMES